MDLRALRDAAALSLVELAAIAGVHPVSLWRVETGRSHPLPCTRRKIAQALGTSPASILWPERPHTKGTHE